MRIFVASEASDFIFTLINFLGFLMSSVAQSQAETVTEGIFLRYPVLTTTAQWHRWCGLDLPTGYTRKRYWYGLGDQTIKFLEGT